MIIAVIVLGIAVVILALLLIQIKIGSGNTVEQIQRIKDQDTNNLVNLEIGMGDPALINEINSLLKMIRQERIFYNRKSHDLEQMMTNISHDLRTPLTSALGYVRLAQYETTDEAERTRELEITERKLRRLQELIDQFFEFYKVISEGKQPEMTQINLIGVLEESISHYYDDYNDRGRRIEFESEKSNVPILSNKDMLMRVFDNLINNAMKHGRETLFITVDPREREIVFKNNTQDKNLDPDHVFDEFYTTDASRTAGSTGLGMAIAKQFIEILGGSINASVVGEDFIVTIKLGLTA